MRLEPWEAQAIATAAADIFGVDPVVRLFGSRVDDAARGGDIDLLVDTDAAHTGRCYRDAFWARLQDALGGQRIDVLVAGPDADSGLGHEARRTGQIIAVPPPMPNPRELAYRGTETLTTAGAVDATPDLLQVAARLAALAADRGLIQTDPFSR